MATLDVEFYSNLILRMAGLAFGPTLFLVVVLIICLVVLTICSALSVVLLICSAWWSSLINYLIHSSNISHMADNTPTSSDDTNKRNQTVGFSVKTMPERLQKINRYSAKWRKTDMRTVVMTILSQTWTHTSGAVTKVKILCPWGMRGAVSKFYTRIVCKNFTALPTELKQQHPELTASKDIYKAVEWTLTVSNTGALPPQKYHRLFCQHCKEVKIPAVIAELGERLGEDKTVDALITNWDVLNLKDAYIDYIGCFLPWDKDVHAAPSARKYIRDQSEHPKTSHMYTVTTVTKKRHKSQASLASPKIPPKTISLEKQPPDLTQYAIVGKKGTRLPPSLSMDNFLNKTSLLGKCSTPMQKLGKGFCLRMIHVGTNKMESQKTIICNYEAGYDGMVSYHETADLIVKRTHPTAVLPHPVKVSLNGHNIIHAQKVILDAYKYDNPESVYKKFDRSPYYSIMHDGITKFSTEYNGVYLRGIDDTTFDPFPLPFCLSKMKGGVNAYDKANEIIRNIADIMAVKKSAFVSVAGNLREMSPDTIEPTPPEYFKLGTLENIDSENKEIRINIDINYPVGNIGDGVSVNTKAARILRDLFGMMCPDYRCCVHIGSGVIKRLTTSKTMNVPEVTVLYECLRTIVLHFETSVKNKELLDECMEILEMTPFHLISWCATRMAHFLKASNVFHKMLPAVYDAMYTRGIRVDDRDLLFTSVNIFILILMSELYPEFQCKYLRKADKTDVLVSTVYATSEKFATEMETFKSPVADAFVEDLKFDDNGNLIASTKINDNVHTMTLNHPHKPTRGISEDDRLQRVKGDLTKLKDKIVQNIVGNIRDQCTQESYFYSWSGLDLDITLSTEERKNRLRDIITLFCTDRSHVVVKYSNKAETTTEPDLWEGYEITLQYPRKIECSEEEMMKELEGVFKSVGPIWLTEINAARAEKGEKKQLSVWKRFLKSHALEYPNASQLMQIMISTSGNTSPVERGYTRLQMIASKRRNRVDPENLETLFLLANLQIPEKRTADYEREIERLNKEQ